MSSKLSFSAPLLIYRFVKHVFPKVKLSLKYWKRRALDCPEKALQEQALNSIESKAFHCLGGSIYSLYPGTNSEALLEFIVAYQTISDYLDNLVDAVPLGTEREIAYAQLHRAMTDALETEAPTSDYYANYPYHRDGDYLVSLVNRCRELTRLFPSYPLVKTHLLWFAQIYSALQVTKHLEIEVREEKMLKWLDALRKDYPDFSVWELAAASGSTLGIFCLLALAANPKLTKDEIRSTIEAYFPWITGLHILLDYFIDLNEDSDSQQLNFVMYYAPEIRGIRLAGIIRESLLKSGKLRYAGFHRMIIHGLLAMYLSDEKTAPVDLRKTTRRLINAGGIRTKVLYWICKQLRKKGIL